MNCLNCGKPLESGARFCSACGRATYLPEAYGPAPTRFVRPREGGMIAGVCAGIAMHYGWDVTLVRLVAALAVCLGAGSPLLLYFIAWIVIPNADYVVVAPPTPPGNIVA